MKNNRFLLSGKMQVARLSFMFSMIFYTASLFAQAPVNFSGTWIQDNVKSDDFYKAFNVSMIIKQTPQVFAVQLIFEDKTGKEQSIQESSFNLDGKEVSKEEQGGINRESAIWSADKKTLTTKSTRSVGSDVYGSTATYTISENGTVLTKQTSDINPLGPSIKQIFNLKK